MSARHIAPLGLLASGVAIGVSLAFAGSAQAEPLTGTGDITANIAVGAGGGGDSLQQLGCERTKKPSCNRPGRRSTRR